MYSHTNKTQNAVKRTANHQGFETKNQTTQKGNQMKRINNLCLELRDMTAIQLLQDADRSEELTTKQREKLITIILALERISIDISLIKYRLKPIFNFLGFFFLSTTQIKEAIQFIEED